MSILQSLQDGSSVEIMSLIYKKVNDLLGSGNQLFAMEFPSRPLNAKTYEYTIKDSYSVLTKPYPVQEAEFILSDQLFDAVPILQGSNGEKLSTVYSTMLNNFVPKLEALQTFVKDQKSLRAWLLEKVVDTVNGETKELSRMAMAKELYREFLEKRNAWYKLKNDTYDRYKSNNDLDGYARWVSTEGLVHEEELNNFYNDAVVRGNYHEVLTLLGFLNVSSPAEVLEGTKQKMRASMRRSLDGSSDVFPVQIQPSDWFRALRPNISPKDLTMATESLVAEYRSKQAKLRSLQSLLTEQAVIEISPDEQNKRLKDIEACEKDLGEAEENMIKQYGAGALAAVKAVINIYKETADPVAKAREAMSAAQAAMAAAKTEGEAPPTDRRIYGLIEGIAQDALNGIVDTYKGQAAVMSKLKKLNEARMAFAEAKVQDMRLQKLRIEEQIKNVQADLDFLTPLVTGTIAETNKEGMENKDTNLMTEPLEDIEDTNFIDVIIKTEDIASISAGSSSASSSQSSFNMGGWFWSASGKQSQTSAASQQSKTELSSKIEIGFRVKKVTFERGGWFNPNVMKLSNNYYRLADIRFSSGLSKEQILNASPAGIKELVTYKGDNANASKKLPYVLPAFPTGFVIAKDVTIRIKSTKAESQSHSSYMESNKSSGGGFLCFSANSSSSSKSQSESAYFGNSENFFYIRIPGPQILGWFLELTPQDNATPYHELDPKLYSTTLESFAPESNKSYMNYEE